MNEATANLLDILTDYSDDSDLQPPIKRGDERHKAIVAHRVALGRRLPPDEAKLMRKLLRSSRSRNTQDRAESQDVASDWALLIEAKYSDGIPNEIRNRLSESELACAEVLTDEPQKTDAVADAAGVHDTTARGVLPKLASMNPPLAVKVRRGYIRPRPR